METLIFFDFETTGLPEDTPNDPLLNPNRAKETPKERTLRLERLVHWDSKKMPRVTEMSFVSVPRQLFVTAARRMQACQYVSAEGGGTRFEPVPVTANVHTRQCDPKLSQQEWAQYEALRMSTQIIQLKKGDLEWKNTFAQEWPGVLQMLAICPKPACLIAHNGVNFDLRLLFHELSRASAATKNCTNIVEEYAIPDKVFFLDSLSTLLDIEMEYNRQMEITTQHIDWRFVFSQTQPQCSASSSTDNTLLPLGEGSTTLLDLTESSEEVVVISDTLAQPPADPLGWRPSELERMQKTPEKKGRAEEENATTMATRKSGSAKRALPFSSRPTTTAAADDEHPLKFMCKSRWSPAKQRRIEPDFFKRNNQGEWHFDGQMARRELVTRGTFRLANLYSRLFAAPLPNHHRAQSDCEALLQVCATYGDDFVKYMDKNASTFPACFRGAGGAGQPNLNTTL